MYLDELNKSLENKENRKAVYETAYKIHLKDRERSIKFGANVHGICNNIRNALKEIYKINFFDYSIKNMYLPEFHDLKPINKTFKLYWWDKKNYEIRKEMYEKYLINI